MGDGIQSDSLFRVRVETAPRAASIVETGIMLLGWIPAVWTNEEEGFVWFDVYLDAESDAGDLQAQLESCLPDWLPNEPYEMSVVPVPSRNWGDAWKEGYHTQRVSERIVVKPSWETHESGPEDCVIELDPSMSFGTGQHATTRACLSFIDTIGREDSRGSFLDIGCGSGILSIAAAKLGFAPITAMDNDPVAIAVARKNLEGNGVAMQVTCYEQDLADLSTDTRFHTVAANLLATPLRHYAKHIAAVTDSYLLVAGVLTSQYDIVCGAYEELGFRQIDCLTEDEWSSGRFQKCD